MPRIARFPKRPDPPVISVGTQVAAAVLATVISLGADACGSEGLWGQPWSGWAGRPIRAAIGRPSTGPVIPAKPVRIDFPESLIDK